MEQLWCPTSLNPERAEACAAGNPGLLDDLASGKVAMAGHYRSASARDVYGRRPDDSPDYKGFMAPTTTTTTTTTPSSQSNVLPMELATGNSDLEESNRVMEQHFDFESAANSPGSMTRHHQRVSPPGFAYGEEAMSETSGLLSRSASGTHIVPDGRSQVSIRA